MSSPCPKVSNEFYSIGEINQKGLNGSFGKNE
jgi:hypothetical protein